MLNVKLLSWLFKCETANTVPTGLSSRSYQTHTSIHPHAAIRMHQMMCLFCSLVMISYLANDPLYPLEFFELFVKKILKLYESLVDFVKVAGFYVIAGS